ncbi:hypothetical protein NM688_g4809 [Phlebia brevispora]|uniref:Uncharacterized protein n=1 Tax=Phlebia brevispora TaxID=194682 RepID=A0ACC1T232_9APHY|nr:hypothetical protein NM688_g4809 [Phlebia brevispora]
MPATAADIPVELYDLILSFYSIDPLHLAEERNHTGVTRSELCDLALVCHRWALACQPKLFHSIDLWNLEDAEGLLELVDHATSRIGGYLKVIRYVLYIDNCERSWVHIACRKLGRSPKLSSEVEFRLNAVMRYGAPTDKQVVMAASNPLPRCSRIMHIQKVDLAHITFRRLEDLGKILRELHGLKEANFREVKWDAPTKGDLPALIPHLSPTSAPITTYSMQGCTDDLAVLWLACLRSPTKTCQIQEQEFQALWQMLTSTADSSIHPVRSQRTDDQIRITTGEDGLTGFLKSPGRSQKRIQILRLDIRMHSWWWSSDRSAIDEQIVSLSDLDAIELSFTSAEHMLDFAERILPFDMPRLCCSTKLQFTFAAGEDELRPSCQTDAVRKAMERSLEEHAKQSGWTSDQTTALLNAFRERDLEMYGPLASALDKALKEAKRPHGPIQPSTVSDSIPDKWFTPSNIYRSGFWPQDNRISDSKGLGHALYMPEPIERYGPVQIGDVGFLQDGGLQRLFNAITEDGFSPNEERPAGFTPLKYDPNLELQPKRYLEGLLVINADFTVKCNGPQGAMLFLETPADMECVRPNGVFYRYIQKHHPSWSEWARKRGFVRPPQDIILVRGFVKASQWALATYKKGTGRTDTSMTATFSRQAGFRFDTTSFQGNVACESRMGPQPSFPDTPRPSDQNPSPLKDQCIFLKYYQLKPRFMRPPKIVVV